MARLVNEDVEFDGLPDEGRGLGAAAVPGGQPRPRAVRPRRRGASSTATVNRHAAFGLGIHRCVGSNLARMELRVALEVWLERFPDFTLADPDAVRWSGGQVRGPRVLPLRVGG